MAIVNKTRKKTLASKHRMCLSIASKALGLMFHRPIKDFALVFDFSRPQKPALHNLFVFFPIDVLFLNEKMVVVYLKKQFMPFSLHLSPKKNCRYVIELPAFTIERSGTKVGDLLELKQN